MPRKPASVKLDDVRERIEELKKEEKKLVQEQSKEEQKQRTHRLCKRGGEVEKLLPDLKTLSEEQFYLFVEKTLLTDSTKRILADIVAGRLKPTPAPQGGTPKQDGETAAPKPTVTAENNNPASPPKPTEAAANTDYIPHTKPTQPAGHNNGASTQKPINTAHNGNNGGNANGGNHERRGG